MMDFILEYWWQTAVYLIGCVLAIAGYNAFCSANEAKMSIVGLFFHIVGSWVALGVRTLSWYVDREPSEKFFKWAPVLLLCVLFAVSCKNQPYKYQCLSTDGTSHGSYFQYPKGTRINWGSGDPAWRIDSCYEFAIKKML